MATGTDPTADEADHGNEADGLGTTTDPAASAVGHDEAADVQAELPNSGQGIPAGVKLGPPAPNRGRHGHHLSSHGSHHLPHLPSLRSLSFKALRLPEADAGVQMRLTEAKEIEPSTPKAINGEASGRTTSKFRKHLTAVGASSLGFRLAESALALIAVVVMCTDSESVRTPRAVFGTLKFNHFQGYRYLVAVNVCVFVYSTLQFIQLGYTVILGISIIPSILISTWVTFAFDQVFAYLLLSASTSAATVANMSHTGEMGINICAGYDLHSFCARADAAVTMSFFAFSAMFSSTILAIYRIGILLREW